MTDIMHSGNIHDIVNIALLSMLIFIACAIAASTNLLRGSIYLSIFSLLMAATYLVLAAPDVAITEAAIGAGISTILFLATILLTGEEILPVKDQPIKTFVIIGFTGAALVNATLGMPQFGDAMSITNQHLVPYYLDISGAEIGIPNVVTSVLASYRGFDTLGETFVVFTAAIALLLILGDPEAEKKAK